jgi:NADPH-dependent 2,4-dienoyl-CoA reductase/sulfur reductase-like enzyme/nitrite reductase/ring-hydroxylating ferredoxin subunit
MQDIVALSDLADNKLVAGKLAGEDVVIVRTGDVVHVLAGTCPHAGAPLADGAVCGGRLICPWHKAVFHLDTGGLVEPPALDGLARYQVTIRNGRVWADPIATPPPAVAPVVTDVRSVAVLGTGAAGVAACVALRDRAYDGRLVMIGSEASEPYDRTSLSKFVLAGELQPNDVYPLREAAVWADRDIERIDAEIVDLDVAGRTVTLADGTKLRYDRAILATGAIPRLLELPGVMLENMFTLRSRSDAAALLTGTGSATRVVIVGSSFIALEAASALRQRDVNVTIVSPQTRPFEHQFGPDIADLFRRVHEDNGVVFHTPAQPVRFVGTERVSAVVLDDGVELPADMVLLGVGVRPATDFVRGADKAADGGIIVDATMHAGNGLYVAGDSAAFPLRGRPTRIEHWRVAQQQARVAAANILGGNVEDQGVPFFWTYHYGQTIEYLGHAEHWDRIEIIGDLAGWNFVALLITGDEVSAVVAAGRSRETSLLVERMRRKLSVEDAMQMIGSN